MAKLITQKLESKSLEWFTLLGEKPRILLIEWLNEYALCLRYGWQFKREIMVYEAGIALGASVRWALGPALQDVNSRLYEVYLAALCYGQEKAKLQEILREKSIDDLIPHGPDQNARVHQLAGLVAATFGDFSQAINEYTSAIAEFKKLDTRRLVNVAHSHVMTGAFKANGRSASERERIRDECLQKIKQDTGQDLEKIVNSFYKKVWRRIWETNDFGSIWS